MLINEVNFTKMYRYLTFIYSFVRVPKSCRGDGSYSRQQGKSITDPGHFSLTVCVLCFVWIAYCITIEK